MLTWLVGARVVFELINKTIKIFLAGLTIFERALLKIGIVPLLSEENFSGSQDR